MSRASAVKAYAQQKKNKAATQNSPAPEIEQSEPVQTEALAREVLTDPRNINKNNILNLQRTVGNQAVLRMLSARNHAPASPKTIQRDDDFVYSRTDSDDVAGSPSTKDYDRGKQTTSTTTSTHGDSWVKGKGSKDTTAVFSGGTDTRTMTTHDVTGKTSVSDSSFRGITSTNTLTYGDDSTHKTTTTETSGKTATSGESFERNSRDIAVSHGTSSSTQDGYLKSYKDTRGTGKDTVTDTREHFGGTETSSSFSQKADLNSAKISGTGDAFMGDRFKTSHSEGQVDTPTKGNQAQTGLGVLDSLLTDKEFLKSLGIEKPNLVEIKDKVLHERGKVVKMEENPGEAAELLFALAKAMGKKDLSERLKAVKTIEDKIIGDSGKKFKPVAALIKDYDVPTLTRWLYSGDPSIVGSPETVISEITTVVDGSGLLTKAGKSKKVIKKEQVNGGHTKTTGSSTVGVGGAGGSFAHSSKAGLYDQRSRTDRGNLGKTSIELENTVANEFMAGARFDASGGAKFSATGINLNLDASAMAGLSDTFTNNTSASSSDGQNKLENKFKAAGFGGVRGDLKSKASFDATGINLGLDASAFAGIEGGLEDSVEFTYKGHKIFALKGYIKGSIGVGGKASFKLNLNSNGNLQLGFELGATLGLGGSVGFEIEVNFKEIGAILVKKLVDALKWLWQKIKSLFTKKSEAKTDIKEGAEQVKQVEKEVAQIPSVLTPVMDKAALSPDLRPLKALKRISSTAANLAGDLDSAKDKLEDASSKASGDKEAGKEVKEATKEIKKEVKNAEDSMKDLAKSF